GIGAQETSSFWSYVWPQTVGTVIASVIALTLATPVAIGVALFISHYVPRRFATSIGYLLDLLAAIPSVGYGAWGMLVLAAAMVLIYRWLHENLDFIQLFAESSTVTIT